MSSRSTQVTRKRLPGGPSRQVHIQRITGMQEKHCQPVQEPSYHARFIDFLQAHALPSLHALVRDTWWPEALGLTLQRKLLGRSSAVLTVLRYDQKGDSPPRGLD